MPQYKQAQQRLDAEVKRWQKEIQLKQDSLEQMKISFENEKILLTEDQQKLKSEEIKDSEKKLKEFVDKKFGTNGDTFSMRLSFAKPAQDQIWNAINAVASKNKYDMIFDKSSSLSVMIFSNPKYDITDKVLKELGLDKKENKTSTKDNTSKKEAAKGLNPMKSENKNTLKAQSMKVKK